MGVTGTAVIGVEGTTGVTGVTGATEATVATGVTVATGATGTTVGGAAIGEPDKSTSPEGTPGIFVCMVDHIIVSSSLFRGTEVTVF